MNKKEIGKYLKLLRENKRLTRSEAAFLLRTTYKSILDWENGVMPSNESLLSLADLFEVSVDDILECGKKISSEDLYKKYPDFNPDYLQAKADYKGINLNYKERLLNAHERFKELVIVYKKRVLTRSEDIELRFLFEKLCDFSEYYLHKNKIENKDKYLCFINALNISKSNNKSAVAYYYEVRRYIDFKNFFKYPYPEYGLPSKDIFKDKLFKNLENWEKDVCLASIQINDAYLEVPDSNWEWTRYNQVYGEEFDKEKVLKRIIRYFIENGAVLNPWLYSFISKKKKQFDILSSLEETYVNYIKPLFISFKKADDPTIEQFGFVENNDTNRFLDDYIDRYFLSGRFHSDELNHLEYFKYISGDYDEEKIVDYLFSLDYPERKEEISFLEKKSMVSNLLRSFNKNKELWISDKKESEDALNNEEQLLQKLSNGETIFYRFEYEDISKEKDFDHLFLMNKWKNLLPYESFMKKRNNEATKELLENLDILSLDEIKEKYFQKEIIEQK